MVNRAIVACWLVLGLRAPLHAQPFAPNPELLPANDPVEHTTLPRPAAIDDAFHAEPRLPLLENLSVFAGLDGSKEPADAGINANFGYRLGVNWGLPVLESVGIGLQAGSALNYARTAVRVLRFVDGTSEHTQSFTTIGLFQRTELGLNWGLAYDYRFDDYYDRFDTSQWRGQIGLNLGPDNEVGVWGTLRDRDDRSRLGGVPLRCGRSTRSTSSGGTYGRMTPPPVSGSASRRTMAVSICLFPASRRCAIRSVSAPICTFP